MAIIHPNSAGRARALASPEMRDAVGHVAGRLADRVRGDSTWDGLVVGVPGDITLPVKVYVNDDGEARAAVVLAHPSGLAVQAKNGLLSRAAANLGLEVNG